MINEAKHFQLPIEGGARERSVALFISPRENPTPLHLRPFFVLSYIGQPRSKPDLSPLSQVKFLLGGL